MYLLGNCPRKVDIVTEVMENELWSSGLLGTSSPTELLRTLVFTLGLNLGLRTGEHRRLRREMFKVRITVKIQFCYLFIYCYVVQFGPERKYFVYTEWWSKNHGGGLRDKMKESKQVTVYSSPNPDRCPVAILWQYLEAT